MEGLVNALDSLLYLILLTFGESMVQVYLQSTNGHSAIAKLCDEGKGGTGQLVTHVRHYIEMFLPCDCC